MCSFFIVILSGFWSIHYDIEDIISIFLPLGGKEWNNISSLALLLRANRLARLLLMHVSFRLPVIFDVLLHIVVLCSVLPLLKVSVLAENLARQCNFISRGGPVGGADLAGLELAFVPL